MKNKTRNTALCGVMTALSVVLMLFTTVLPILMYVLPIVTGLLVLFTADIINKKWAAGVYFSVAFLSIFLLTDKEAALTYCLFFGYYPIIKDVIEKLPVWASRILKFLLFNIAAVLIGVTGTFIFGISGDEYNEFGKLTIPILLFMANIVFILYDVCLTKYRFLLTGLSQKFKKAIK